MKTDETVLRALKKAFLIGKIYGEVFESIDSADQTAAGSKKLEFERLCEATIRNLNSYALQHPDDEAVDRFANAMKQKLAQAREKGRSGWQQMNPNELSGMLYEHVAKGDPRDVANFCMFLWNLGQPITPCQPVQPAGAQGEPVAYTNKEQLGYLKDPKYIAHPMAMWASKSPGSDIALYTAPPAVAINEQLLKALADTDRIIGGQLELIKQRANGDFLNKRPVVQSLTAHRTRIQKAIAASEAEKAKGGAA